MNAPGPKMPDGLFERDSREIQVGSMYSLFYNGILVTGKCIDVCGERGRNQHAIIIYRGVYFRYNIIMPTRWVFTPQEAIALLN